MQGNNLRQFGPLQQREPPFCFDYLDLPSLLVLSSSQWGPPAPLSQPPTPEEEEEDSGQEEEEEEVSGRRDERRKTAVSLYSARGGDGGRGGGGGPSSTNSGGGREGGGVKGRDSKSEFFPQAPSGGSKVKKTIKKTTTWIQKVTCCLTSVYFNIDRILNSSGSSRSCSSSISSSKMSPTY